MIYSFEFSGMAIDGQVKVITVSAHTYLQAVETFSKLPNRPAVMRWFVGRVGPHGVSSTIPVTRERFGSIVG